MNRTVFLASVLLLAGCAGQTPGTPAILANAPALVPTTAAPIQPLVDVANFTVADLQAAKADADANGDKTSAPCWDFLAKSIQGAQLPTTSKTLGAFLLFQKGRDLLKGGQNGGWTTDLNIACAPLVTDVRLTLAKFGLIAAGTAATGGALAPALPGLSAIGAVLPIPLL